MLAIRHHEYGDPAEVLQNERLIVGAGSRRGSSEAACGDDQPVEIMG